MKRILVIMCLFPFMGFWLTGCNGQREEVKTSPPPAQVAKPEESQLKGLGGKKVVMIISPEDFRDEELIEPQSVLSEEGAEVKIASLILDTCRGTLGTLIIPDLLVRDIRADQWDAVILVGGPGSKKYWEDAAVHAILTEAVKQNKIVGAVCIAPVTCANAGILNGKKATVHESETSRLKEKGAEYTGASVQRDGRIITANGPPAAKEFGEAIAAALKE